MVIKLKWTRDLLGVDMVSVRQIVLSTLSKMAASKDVTTAVSNNSNSGATNNHIQYGKVILSLENCLLPLEKLENAPSLQDGLDKEAELDLRILGCEMIQTAGILLRLPQVAMATGQVLFHRFFYSKSFVKYNYEVVAMGCVCLASKIEEAPRRIRDVINVFNHIKQVRSNRTIQPVILDQNYINLKNQVIKAERRVLKELGFCVHVKHPHKIIVMYLKVLEIKNNQEFTQLSWNYMNDSLRTDAFLRYSPETIACACIYLSARQLKIGLPNKPVWYQIFRVEEDDIRAICEIILRLYIRPKPNVDKLEKAVDELKKAQEEAKLRAKGLSASNTPQTGGFSPNSRSNSPNKGDRSPAADSKKEKGQENSKNKNNHVESPNKRSKDTNHVKNHSPNSNASGGCKSASHSSRSHSRSTSPKRKGRSPPRSYKESRKAAAAASPPSRSRSRSKSGDRKKRRLTKHRRSRSRSHSYTRSPHRNHKKSHKEKPRYRSRSRERAYRSRSRSYEKYNVKSRKSERPARDNGHHRSRSRDRSRR